MASNNHILNIFLRYDLVSSVLPAAAEWSVQHALHSTFELPDVVLVKKVQSAMGRAGDAMTDIPKDAIDKPKAKSSGSKRKEKRKLKQEKKEKDLAAVANRMGIVINDDGDLDVEWDQERKTFEEELKNDIELAAEFRSLVEKELDMAKEALDGLVLEETEEENSVP